MLLPYLLGVAVVYASAIEAIDEFEDAKDREYKMWYYKDEAIPPGKLLKAFVGSILYGFSFHYEFSAHAAMISVLCITVLSEFASWKRLKEYKKPGELIASTLLLVVISAFTLKYWDWYALAK
jgi:hypothetical protein